MLIERLIAGGTELCVVGDDGQAIYQWRGSDVGNITSFVSRYPGVRQFHITTNRRSRRKIIDAETVFAQTIPGRLDKHMSPYRPTADAPEIVVWGATAEQEEAGQITYPSMSCTRSRSPTVTSQCSFAEGGVQAVAHVRIAGRDRVRPPEVLDWYRL